MSWMNFPKYVRLTKQLQSSFIIVIVINFYVEYKLLKALILTGNQIRRMKLIWKHFDLSEPKKKQFMKWNETESIVETNPTHR